MLLGPSPLIATYAAAAPPPGTAWPGTAGRASRARPSGAPASSSRGRRPCDSVYRRIPARDAGTTTASEGVGSRGRAGIENVHRHTGCLRRNGSSMPGLRWSSARRVAAGQCYVHGRALGSWGTHQARHASLTGGAANFFVCACAAEAPGLVTASVIVSADMSFSDFRPVRERALRASGRV